MTTILACIAFCLLTFFTLVYFLATIIRNNGIVDIAWGIGFVIVSLIAYGYGMQGTRSLIVGFLVLIWGLRLAIHIYLRNKGKGEDFRYRAWREEWGDWWVVRSYFQIFVLQWFLALLVSVPILFVHLTPDTQIGFWDYLGITIWVIGFVYEALGDYQLTQFKKNKKNKGKLMTKGLWSTTRHPNYFGEALLWWGIALMAFIQTNSLLVFVGPLLIDFLLLKVSGIPMLEKKYEGRKDWEKYKKQVPAFFPKIS